MFTEVLAHWALPTSAADAAARVAEFLEQLSLWETSVVGLYVVIMATLSFYGSHRLRLVWLYYRRRGHAVGAPASRFKTPPRVTVQLPLYNERFVVENLIESVCRLDYPRERLQIQVLDDSTDETAEIARAAVERMARRGHPIELLHRVHREGYKAGALAAGMQRATGELIAIFDADFSPAPDFLRRTVDQFTNPKVGMVQTRWTYRNREQSLLTRVQAMLLDAHFVFEHGARSRSGLFFNFNGTAGVLRRTMIEDAGGWQFDTLTEDTDLSYRAQLRGWRYLYLPDVEAPSELPSDAAAFQVQQARWAKGLVQTGIKLLPTILRSRQPLKVKAEAFHHLTANLSYPLMAALALLLLPAAVIRFDHRQLWLLLLDIPIFLSTFASLAVYYLLAQREIFGRVRARDVLLFPAALAAGIGLTLSNTKAVCEALLGISSPFQRTAKYSGDLQHARQVYGRKLDWTPWANLAIGLYFAASLGYSAWIGNWGITPFLALFVSGFLATGGLTLLETSRRWEARKTLRIEQLSRDRERAVSA